MRRLMGCQGCTIEVFALDLLGCGLSDAQMTEHIGWECNQRFPEVKKAGNLNGCVASILRAAKEKKVREG